MHKFDNLIIGSGAGGSVAAWVLSEAKQSVALLEEGFDHNLQTLSTNLLREISAKYRSGGARAIFSNVGIIPYGEGALVGGSTEINGGLFWRTPPHVLGSWLSSKNLKLYTPESHSMAQSIIESLMKPVSENHDPQLDIGCELLSSGAKKIGLKVVAARRVVHGCRRWNLCAVGCPPRAKSSMSQTLIPSAIKNGLQLFEDSKVVRIKKHQTAYLVTVRHSAGKNSTFEAKRIFIAGGNFESVNLAALLTKRGFLVRRFGLHLNSKFVAHFPDLQQKSTSTLFTSQIQSEMEDGILFMGTADGTEYLGLSSPRDLAKEFQSGRSVPTDGYYSYTLQLDAEKKGIVVSFRGHQWRFFWVGSKTRRRFEKGSSLLVRSLFEAGASRVFLPNGEALEEPTFREGVNMRRRLRRSKFTSVHGMSSLGDLSDKGSALDSVFGLKGSQHVYAVDASALPGTVGESPQETIMVQSFMTVHNIVTGRPRL